MKILKIKLRKQSLDIGLKPVLILFLVLSMMSCTSIFKSDNAELELERKVDSLLALMTLEEKIGQMTQVRHFADIQDEDITTRFIGSVIHTAGPEPGQGALGWQQRFVELQQKALETRLGIPLLFAVDAVHGQNTFNGATIFPHNIGMGATHNEKLVKKAAQITAYETQASGFNWTFSPCIAIPFNEKWGRFYEAFAECTELTTALTIASIEGHQGALSDATTVMATAKHFVGDGATINGVEGGESILSKEEIHQILLPPYEAAVKADVGAIMVSFNTISEVPMHAHKNLITHVLKDSLNFQGMVVTDWKGYSRFGGNDIINAGVDMVMAVDGDLDRFQNGVFRGVQEHEIAIERIDDAVRRILRQKFKLGLFENPFPKKELVADIGCESHRDVARQAVRESLVLLKNDSRTLPIDKETKKIVVVGPHGNNTGLQSGGWTIYWQGTAENYRGATTIYEGIKEISNGEVVYDPYGNEGYFDADIAIVVVGEHPYAEMYGDIGDGTGNHTLNLSEENVGIIKSYLNKVPKVVVILVAGRPLVVTNEIDDSDAFVMAWLPGSEGGGVAEVLFGDYDFMGRLPHSWPKSMSDFDGNYGPNMWDNSIKPLYPFGYGLTY